MKTFTDDSPIYYRGIKFIGKEELKDKKYYKGICRNATEARWFAGKGVFTYWRKKFGNTFLENIKCPEDDKAFDIFLAQEEIENGKESKEIPNPANY